MTTCSTALVTGASSGIGEAFARRLAGGGTDLVLVARREDRLHDLADRLTRRHKVGVEVIVADLVVAADRRLVEDRLGSVDAPLDMLVNSAGFACLGEFGSNDVDRELAQVDLNVAALVRLSHAAVGPMRERGRGWILNVSSLGAFQPGPDLAVYAATKAFVNSFSEALHVELRGSGVNCTAVCPGFTRTEFQQVAGEASEANRMPGFMWQTADEVVDDVLRRLPKDPAVVVTGVHNRVMAGVVSVLPRRTSRWMAAVAARNM